MRLRAGRPSGKRPSRDVASRKSPESLGISVGAVYTTKSRILERIRKEIQQAQGDEPFVPRWDRDEIHELS